MPGAASRRPFSPLPALSLPGSSPSQRSSPGRHSAPPAAAPASDEQSTEPIREPAYGRLKTHSFIWVGVYGNSLNVWWDRMLFKDAV